MEALRAALQGPFNLTGPSAPESRSSGCPRGLRTPKARDQAVSHARAADGEDASVKDVAMENRLYPMRELLGDLLLADGSSPGPRCRNIRCSAEDDPQPLPRPQRRWHGRVGRG